MNREKDFEELKNSTRHLLIIRGLVFEDDEDCVKIIDTMQQSKEKSGIIGNMIVLDICFRNGTKVKWWKTKGTC